MDTARIMLPVTRRQGACPSGCEAGYYGERCDSVCGNCREGATCDTGNGNCPNGCAAGHEGNKCQQGTIYHKNIFIINQH